MSGNNDESRKLHNITDATLQEITQLCNDYPSASGNFHQFGFECLLKKLKEIERIILAISKMPVTVQSAAKDEDNCCPSAMEENCMIPNGTGRPPEAQLQSQQCQDRSKLNLPEDLTPHTKVVLNKIYERFEAGVDQYLHKIKIKFHETLNESYCKSEIMANEMREKQTKAIKYFIENLLEVGEGSVKNLISDDVATGHDKVEKNNITSSDHELHLPDDLTPLTKFVLKKIFENFENNFNDFYEKTKTGLYDALNESYSKFDYNTSIISRKQKTELKNFIENFLIINYESNASCSNIQENEYLSDSNNEENKNAVHQSKVDQQIDHEHFKNQLIELNRIVETFIRRAKCDNDLTEYNFTEQLENLDNTQYLEMPSKFVPRRKKNA